MSSNLRNFHSAHHWFFKGSGSIKTFTRSRMIELHYFILRKFPTFLIALSDIFFPSPESYINIPLFPPTYFFPIIGFLGIVFHKFRLNLYS